jgi:tetratricopeptide (TPR) repeat protein
MSFFPKDPKKIRARIRSYERKLRKEKEEYGDYSDGYGKRYLLGTLYLLMDDTEGALTYFDWFEQEFPDDSGDTIHYLSWTLALFRAGDLETATRKFGQAMLSNLLVMPELLDLDEEIDLGEMDNMLLMMYLEDLPEEVFEMWQDAELDWGRKTYYSADMTALRERYIEIEIALNDVPPSPKRNELVAELFQLRNGMDFPD